MKFLHLYEYYLIIVFLIIIFLICLQPDDFPVGLKRPPPLNMRTSNGNPLAAVSGVPTGLMAPMPFSIPAPFPFPHPAFLPQLANPGAPPASTPPAPLPNNNVHSSGSSHSSESSNGSHQTWSFEEQFKQVRQASDLRILCNLYALHLLHCII